MEDFLKEAEALQRAKQYAKAVQAYSKAIDADPNQPDAVSSRGVCYFHLEDMQNALADMNKAVELQPDYAYRYASRAYILDRLGKTEEAVADYRKAVKLDPEDAIAYNNLGLLEEKLGYIQQAKKNFKRADELAPNLPQMPDPASIENDNTVTPTAAERTTSSNAEATTKGQVVAQVFGNKEVFKEFVRFIKNGWKRK